MISWKDILCKKNILAQFFKMLAGNLKLAECLYYILSIQSLSWMIRAGCNDVELSIF